MSTLVKPGSTITMQKAKLGGRIKRVRTGLFLEMRDDWLVVLHEPGVHSHHKDGVLIDHDTGTHIFYLNTRLPLTVRNGVYDGRFGESYIDAALPATFEDGIATYIDLEIDIVAEEGETPYIKDILEFERQRTALPYAPEVTEAAWQGIRIGLELFAAGVYPFDGSAEETAREGLRRLGR
jgi:protein associated with RNAse G/E